MAQKITTHEMGSRAPKDPTPRKIIVCIDGTGQDETKPRATNVRKFADLLLKGEASQKAIYLPGPGSKTDKQRSPKLFGNVGGSGAKRMRAPEAFVTMKKRGKSKSKYAPSNVLSPLRKNCRIDNND